MYLGTVSILTDDVPRLAAFYKALLGVDNGSDDPVHQTIIAEETMLTVYDDGQPKGDGQRMCLAFTVEDVYAEHERLKAMGVEIIEPPTARPWGAVNVVFRDPDGNAVYLRSFPKHAEEGVRPASMTDLDWLAAHDHHVSRDTLSESIRQGRVLIAERDGGRVGWLRWNLFWDNTPFMNMLYLLDGHRGQGLGRVMVRRWEADMAAQGHELVMTSTQADESAQHFYRKLGWRDAGALLLPGETTELFFVKELS
ncbi:MAG: GNAT family N-acetyltransferase [Christensenellaceae bacterium]|nr:GNAT family N-acetyltransferase [Christensenellaceae bacterium]